MPLVLLLALAGGWWWRTRSQDFYHQPASYRYRMQGGNDQALLAQWRARGPEGIQELARHIPVPNRYFGVKYRSFVSWLEQENLAGVFSWLPTPRISERILESISSVRLLRELGPDACAPQTVAALAKAIEDSNSRLASDAVECLRSWGPAASNALPALLKAQRKETQNGGRVRSANLPLNPDYAAALASIGVNAKESLIELLRAKPANWTKGYAETWCRNSSQASVILVEIVTNQAVEVEIRAGAIAVASACQIESLLPYVAPTLAEPKLGQNWQFYLRRMKDKAGPYWGPILNQLGALADIGFSTNAGLKEWEDVGFSTNAWRRTWEEMVFDIGLAGKARVEELFPIVLRYSLDEQWPYAKGYAWANKPLNLHAAFGEQLLTLASSQAMCQNLILSGLEHSDWRVRAGAAEQLLFAKLSPREIDALVKCLRDENATVRAIAAQLLLRVEAHRPEALQETWTVITNRSLPFRRRICAIGSVRGVWLSAGDKLEAAKILDILAEEPEAELRDRALAKRKELAP